MQFSDLELLEATRRFCPGCSAGGTRRAPQHAKSKGPSLPAEPGERFHMDTMVNKGTKDRLGNKYSLVICDVSTTPANALGHSSRLSGRPTLASSLTINRNASANSASCSA